MGLDGIVGEINRMARKSRNHRNRKGGRVTQDSPVSFSLKLADMINMEGPGDEYYYYQGGLTTPECNEIVQWTSYINTVPVSEAQLEKFRMLVDKNGEMFNDNYRPPQPLFGRVVSKRVPKEPDTSLA